MGVLAKLFGPRVVSVTPDEAEDLRQDGAVLVDVRERAEWDGGHAPKARHVPLGRLHQDLDRIPEDRTIVVICASGHRSARGTRILLAEGRDAVSVRGGMHAWRAAGLPVVGARGGRSGRRGRVA